jgi:hypothetical protein
MADITPADLDPQDTDSETALLHKTLAALRELQTLLETT